MMGVQKSAAVCSKQAKQHHCTADAPLQARRQRGKELANLAEWRHARAARAASNQRWGWIAPQQGLRIIYSHSAKCRCFDQQLIVVHSSYLNKRLIAAACGACRPHPYAPTRPPWNVPAMAAAVPVDMVRDAVRCGLRNLKSDVDRA